MAATDDSTHGEASGLTPSASTNPTRAYSWALAATGLSYAVLHHLGLLPGGLGAAPEGTRWAAPASTHSWAIFGAGVVAYSSVS